MVIDPLNYRANIYGDGYSGGNSEASWIDESAQHWRCEIGNQFITPYCSLTLQTTSETWSGLDLRKFSDMTIWASYKGPNDHIRLYLRNRHPNYFEMGDETTAKPNMVEVPAEKLEEGFTLKMKDFIVAPWWVTSRSLPLEYSHPEFNDIIMIEVQTGSQAFAGAHDIQFKKMVLQGQYFTNETLYKGIVIAWSASVFFLLLYRIIMLKIELTRSQRYQKELVSINSVLNLQNKQFEDLAKTDHLTGLLNRIGIRDVLYEGVQLWKKNRTPFSFVLIDLDHFKKINDTYGHEIGDKVLQAVSQLLKESVRRSDCVARWGGEEFLLVCTNTDIGQAHVLAELLRKKLEDSALVDDIKVTASFGVASMTQPEIDHLFNKADAALYEAKRSGRNKVVCEQ